MESRRFKGFLLSVDLEKAFDNVSHKFLRKVLEKFAFPAQLINCVKNLYDKATSKIMHNGFLSSDLNINPYR